MNDFEKTINKMGPTRVSKILECSLSTTKKWSCKKQTPPEWVKKLILKKIKEFEGE